MSDAALAPEIVDGRASERLARGFAAVLPALVLAYPMLISPLVHDEARLTALSDFQAPQAVAGEASVLTRIYFPALLALASAAFLAVRPRLSGRQVVLGFWVAAFLALAYASSLWSLAPAHTFMKAAYQTIIVAVLFLAAATARDPRRILVPIFWLLFLVVVANLPPVLTRPPGIIGHEGIYGQKNTLGTNAAVACLFGIFALRQRHLPTRLAGLLTVIGSVVLLLASDSKTALGLAAIAPLAALSIVLMWRAAAISPVVSFAGCLVFGLALYALAYGLLGFTLSDVFLALFGDATFTGRTHIWSFTWSHVLERPLLGHGYQGFWDIGPDSPKFSAEMPFIAKMPYAHNGFLDVLLELGIVGLGIFTVIFILVLSYLGALRESGPGIAFLSTTIVVFAFGRNMMESNWFVGSTTVGVLFLLVGFIAAIPAPWRGRPVYGEASLHRSAAEGDPR